MQNIAQKNYDVVIIGAGLAGMTAAIDLQRDHYNVLLLDKHSVPGGLCGGFKLDNYEFVIGCNDFCQKVADILKQLDVQVAFKKSRMRFYLEDTTFNIPPTPSTIFKLLLRFPDLIRMLRFLKKNDLQNISLAELANKCIKDPKLADFIKAFAYPNGMRPEELMLTQLKKEFSKEFDYNYQQAVVPVNDPISISRAMADKFTQLGGTLLLNTQSLQIKNGDNNKKLIVTNNGEFNADYVISSEGRYDQYPKNYKPGLAISKFSVVVNNNLVFPKGYHTLIYLPANVSQWLNKIDNGEMPEQFLFHLFPSGRSANRNYYSLNIYIYLPRDLAEPQPAQIAQVRDYVFAKINSFLPGFMESIIYERFISAAEFVSIRGVSSIVSPIIDPTFKKPAIYDPQKDIYYIGNSVYPPGNHAGAAMLSALMAAEQIKARKNL